MGRDRTPTCCRCRGAKTLSGGIRALLGQYTNQTPQQRICFASPQPTPDTTRFTAELLHLKRRPAGLAQALNSFFLGFFETGDTITTYVMHTHVCVCLLG